MIIIIILKYNHHNTDSTVDNKNTVIVMAMIATFTITLV